MSEADIFTKAWNEIVSGRNYYPGPVKILFPQWKIDHYVCLGYPRDMFEVEPELPEELNELG